MLEVSIKLPTSHEPPPDEIVVRLLYETEIFDLPDEIRELYDEIRKEKNYKKS